MWIDLCLQHLILSPLHQKPVLVFLLRHRLHTVEHFIKLRPEHLQLLRPPDGLHPKLRLSVFDPFNPFKHLLNRAGQPFGKQQHKHRYRRDHHDENHKQGSVQ